MTGLSLGLGLGLNYTRNAGGGASLLEQALALAEPIALYEAGRGGGTIATDGTGDNAGDTDVVGRIPDLSGSGNTLIAGTWASPSDTARATRQLTGGFWEWNFNGSNNFYEFLNAIAVTTDMTAIRAFGRASVGIRSIGLGVNGAAPHDAVWFTNNLIYNALNNAGDSTPSAANTSTGAFVATVRRNASAKYTRLNGTQVATGAPGAITGASVTRLGMTSAGYNNGPIQAQAVFSSELSADAMAAWEAYFASLNGAVLA